MKILGIETSCDETALAVIEASGDLHAPHFTVLNTALYSQIETHRQYGGVFPAVAKREHAHNFTPLLESLLSNATTEPFDASSVDWENIKTMLDREPDLFEKLKAYIETHEKPLIDLITVTEGPGLEPALWVGINAARALSCIWNIPMLGINHMEGHIASVLLEKNVDAFPVLALLISGGHTELVLVEHWGAYTKIGETRDDAIGEAYDKVARMLGLPYPGGPEISKLARYAREHNILDESLKLPRPMLHTADFDFSLSGLKTAVLYKVQALGELTDTHKYTIAREFEQAITDVITIKTRKAIEAHEVHGLIVGGGVIANTYIREALTRVGAETNIPVFFPTHALATDNAVMIATVGYLKQHTTPAQIAPELRANGNLSL